MTNILLVWGLVLGLVGCAGGEGGQPPPGAPATGWSLVEVSVPVADAVHVVGSDDYVIASGSGDGARVYDGRLDALRIVDVFDSIGALLPAVLWTDGDTVLASGQLNPYVPVLAERGADGWVQHWDGISYDVYPLAVSARDDAFMGGFERLVHFDGQDVHVTELGAREDDLRVYPAFHGGGELLGLGRSFDETQQAIYRWQDAGWVAQDSFAEGELIDALWGDDSGVRWAIGTGIYERRGDGWRRTHPSLRLRAIAGDAANDLYVVGDAGTLLHFDGTQWSAIEVPTSHDLTRVRVGAAEVLIVTAEGELLRAVRD